MRYALSLSLLALAPGCAGTGGDPADSGVTEDPYEPAPYIIDDEAPPAPSFSAEEVSAAIGDALAMLPEITGVPVFPAYFAAMEGQTAGCPDYYEFDGNVYWYDYCTSDEGTSFEGYSFYYAYDGYEQDGLVYDGDVLSGVARVQNAEGHLFEAGGTAGAIHAVAQDGTYEYYQSVVQGSFGYDGPEARGTWLEDYLAPDVTQLVYNVPSTGGRAFVLDGGVADLPGAFPVVVFDNVLLVNAAAGGACPQEPGGVISVRDTDGNWYDVLLDGESEFGGGIDDRGLCDGCGTAWFRGEQVGSVCADFAALNEWEGAPW